MEAWALKEEATDDAVVKDGVKTITLIIFGGYSQDLSEVVPGKHCLVLTLGSKLDHGKCRILGHDIDTDDILGIKFS